MDSVLTPPAGASATPLLDSRPWRLWVVPHTHWDREWYLPLEDFRIRLADVLDGVIATLEARPEYRFTLDGQAIIVEDYLELRPEMEGRLRSLLASGRLETGPSYVLPDEFLVGGESLVRNLLLGRAVCARYGAQPAPVAYLPDSFGHPAQLPQILTGFGLDTLVFWRGLGDERERLGARFDWRAPDGSRVLALPMPAAYNNAAALGHSRRSSHSNPADNAADRIEAILREERHMLADADLRDLLLANGDDHARLQEDLPEVLRDLRASRPGLSATMARLSDYAAVMRAGGPFPEFQGELCGGAAANVLRGVNSARIYLKQENERCERELQAAETLASLATLADPGFRYPRGELRLAWRELLRNHPHDSICGCSVDETHDDMDQRFRSSLMIARRVAHMAVHALADVPPGRGENESETHGLEGRYRWAYLPLPDGRGHVVAASPGTGLFNVLPFRRRRLVALDVPAELQHRPLTALSGGDRLPLQIQDGRAWVEADTPALGVLDVALAEGEPRAPAEAATALGDRAIQNARYRVTAAPDGTLTLLERRSGRLLDGLHVLEDVADRGDSYTFCPLEGDDPVTSAGGAADVRVTASGPVYAELEIAHMLELPAGLATDRRSRKQRTVPCPVVTRVRLTAGGDRIEFRARVDNQAGDHRLRVRFRTPRPAREVRAEGQFAVARRPARPTWNGRWKEPPADTQHTLGAIAAGGLVLFTRGLPEYEAIETADGRLELAITLLRCVGWLSRADLTTRHGRAGPELPVPGAQCPGEHELEYALALGLPADAELVRASQDYRFDLVAGPSGAARREVLAVQGDAVLSAFKGAEDGDGVIIRLHNPGAEPVRARVGGNVVAERCRMDETAAEGRPAVTGALALVAGEIATLRLRPA